MPRFFTRNEVREHCTENDAYVSANGQVLDLTPLIQKYKAAPTAYLTLPLLRVAGSDISHWFDADSEPRDLKTCVDSVTGLVTYAQPFGRMVHVPTQAPDSTIDTTYELPWWQDPVYVVGQLTRKSRKLRVINTLNGHEITLEVCSEETLRDIVKTRYIFVNAHAHSYTWMRHDAQSRVLDMSKTLDDNGIFDEAEEFEAVGLSADFYIPAVHLYFNDDLTIG
mmetsp:Transcript_34598/g.40461  ORF Transcript_34598/g.40461 Transcript_34598/m.40461 type:complete len:223 (-) Transcript_34598:191-859(-)